MTQVEFHFNVADKTAHVRQLAAKAVAAGDRQAIVAAPDVLRQLDQSLWSAQPLSFVPHCMATSPLAVRRRSPLILCDSLGGLEPAARVVINLLSGVPNGFEASETLIEIIGLDEDDRTAGRQRWRHYAQRGYAIARHDVGAA